MPNTHTQNTHAHTNSTDWWCLSLFFPLLFFSPCAPLSVFSLCDSFGGILLLKKERWWYEWVLRVPALTIKIHIERRPKTKKKTKNWRRRIEEEEEKDKEEKDKEEEDELTKKPQKKARTQKQTNKKNHLSCRFFFFCRQKKKSSRVIIIVVVVVVA